jgi:hypothetical protein
LAGLGGDEVGQVFAARWPVGFEETQIAAEVVQLLPLRYENPWVLPQIVVERSRSAFGRADDEKAGNGHDGFILGETASRCLPRRYNDR